MNIISRKAKLFDVEMVTRKGSLKQPVVLLIQSGISGAPCVDLIMTEKEAISMANSLMSQVRDSRKYYLR